MTGRLSWQRAAAFAAVGCVAAASLVTGSVWRVAVDSGGETAGNPVSRYGPHWLFPTLAAIVVCGLLAALARRPYPLWIAVALTAAAAGGAGNLAQWTLLGGVSNPIGPLPGIHGTGHASIGDACLWLAMLALLVQVLHSGGWLQRPAALSRSTDLDT